MLVITILMWCWVVSIFEYFLSARPCSEQNISIFPCLGQKPRNLCSFLSYLPSNCWQVCSALSLPPLWLSPLLPSFTVLLPGGYSLGSQISFLSLTVHSPCSQVAFWNPTSCSPQSLLMASLHTDSKIQALMTIQAPNTHLTGFTPWGLLCSSHQPSPFSQEITGSSRIF